VYETLLAPTVQKASDARHARKRQFEALTANAAKGRPALGRDVYAQSACVACHRAGDLGRTLGPDLSRIGGIRQARDVFESIFFPSATIAREFDTHVVETADGQSLTGTIRADVGDAMLVVDATGQEKTIAHRDIVANSTLPTSLMPEGLDQTLTEQQLLDLVAWLLTLK
jgi:putative heme-binding domain-containing protein